MLRELILKNRSYRRFHEEFPLDASTLMGLVDLARLSASASNLQPLKYILTCDPTSNRKVFPNLRWAAYLKDWSGPPEGERPSAYIIILADTRISQSIGPDHGIAAQSILLGAAEMGFGGCMIASLNRTGLRSEFQIPDIFEILMVIALGKPKEIVVLEALPPSGDIRYWRDAAGVHHVPKRSLDEIILRLDVVP
jgi:nitroreductase